MSSDSSAACERKTVTKQFDEATQKYFLQGVETADENRANVFGKWKETPHDNDYEGHYVPATRSGTTTELDDIGVEAEVKFCWFDGDVDDHAEVYHFKIYCWKNRDGILIAQEEEWAENDFVMEQGALYGPLSLYSAIVRRAAERIQDARYNKIEFDPAFVREWL